MLNSLWRGGGTPFSIPADLRLLFGFFFGGGNSCCKQTPQHVRETFYALYKNVPGVIYAIFHPLKLPIVIVIVVHGQT